MVTHPFNTLANSHHAREAWELSAIYKPDVSLVVLQQPLAPDAQAYVESLDFKALRHSRNSHQFEGDPFENFYFVWNEGKRYREESHEPDFRRNLTVDYLRTVMPRTEGSESFFNDVARRAKQFEEATSSRSLRCELRYSEHALDKEYFHTDSGGTYRAGTAYLDRATGFIAQKYLIGKNLNTASVAPTQADIAPHIVEPALHDLYLFKINRPHCVPYTAKPRLVLIMSA